MVGGRGGVEYAHDGCERIVTVMYLLAQKHNDVRRLEASIEELAQMFYEIATLIEQQGLVIDQVDMFVDEALTNQEKATQQMMSTKRAQKKKAKCMCWMTWIMALVLLCVAVGLIIKFSIS